MARFGINDILNAKSKAGAAGMVEKYTEIYLSPYEVQPAPENTHQQLTGIEELADSFLHVGQEQPTVLARVNGEFRIIDGHRRNAANIFNLERGHKEYEKVAYRYRDMSEAMYELSLLAGNGYTQELTPYEKMRLVERTKAALIRAKEEDGLEIRGKMRDLIAEMIGENVARMESINNNAVPEVKEALKNGDIGITAAYEAAKLGENEQREIAAQAAAGENVRAKEIAAKVAEKKAGDDYETPHPESITSLCYSCQRYKECNVKTGTCEKCDQYINKAEAEKTAEQLYSEEQDRIDKETKRKLQERADAEKMESLPSERAADHKQHEIKIATSYYDDVASGKKSFELRKNDRDYKEGDSLKMLEFKDGKYMGNTIDADIVYMLEDYTGLAEGYCILGIRVTAYSKKVSETDTESGAGA
jgi:ParB-like chromosome segregation protein Spo0J